MNIETGYASMYSRLRTGMMATALLLLPLCHSLAGDGIAPPNIIFIMADDLGYGDLGCYGQKVLKTPRIDELAKEGMRFTDCYAGSTVCAPSRCVLMTGYHTGHARIRGNALVPLLPEDVTVAEILKRAGYYTGMIGKWGLGEPGTTGVPNKQGFDEWFGYLNQKHAHNYYPEFLWHNDVQVRMPGNVSPNGVAIEKGTHSQDAFLKETLDFLERNKDRRFFLYLPWTLPHANNEAGGKVGNGMEIPSLGEYADRDWPEPEKGRAAMIGRLDSDVGAVLDKLNELGLADNTIVFFTSDNGPHSEGKSQADFFKSSGPLRGIKRDLYEGGIREPMIVRWPGHVQAGSVNHSPWAFWDFLPTAADLAHAEVPKGIDGRSIVPLLLGESAEEHTPFYWEFHERGFDQAVRIGHWKGVRRGSTKAPIELYDLDQDLGERKNVAEDHPDVVKQIEEVMESSHTPSEVWSAKKSVDLPLRRKARRPEKSRESGS